MPQEINTEPNKPKSYLRSLAEISMINIFFGFLIILSHFGILGFYAYQQMDTKCEKEIALGATLKEDPPIEIESCGEQIWNKGTFWFVLQLVIFLPILLICNLVESLIWYLVNRYVTRFSESLSYSLRFPVYLLGLAIISFIPLAVFAFNSITLVMTSIKDFRPV